jgi:hypothetical protein
MDQSKDPAAGVQSDREFSLYTPKKAVSLKTFYESGGFCGIPHGPLVNDRILPADRKKFFGQTHEPGVVIPFPLS